MTKEFMNELMNALVDGTIFGICFGFWVMVLMMAVSYTHLTLPTT